MDDSNGLIFDILTQVLGQPRTHYPSKGQASWNCPVCDNGKYKGNFEVNYFKEVYQCWSCGETNDTHGSIYKLIKLWGTRQQLSNYVLLRPDIVKRQGVDDIKVFMGLPSGFISFNSGNPHTIDYKIAYNYITKDRGITDAILRKFKIGYTVDSKFHHRIIIPSHNVDGDVDYFSARTYVNAKKKYDNPDYPKEKIIFNEYYIDWEQDVYLLEGALDHLVVPNSIPMLGKKMSDLLWNRVYDNAKANVIIAYDPDAMGNIKKLYQQLDGGKLKGRVKALFYKSEFDLCELHRRLSAADFIQLLKSARIIKESKL